MSGFDDQGRAVSYTLADGVLGSMLFSVDPDCPACVRMLPFVDSLQRVSGCHVRSVGLFLGPRSRLAEFIEQHSLGFPVLYGASSALFTFLPLTRSPVIVVVDRRGAVAGTWEGFLDSEERAELRRMVSGC